MTVNKTLKSESPTWIEPKPFRAHRLATLISNLSKHRSKLNITQGNSSSDDGDTNENFIWKNALILVCYLEIIWTHLTCTKTANYLGTKLVGLAFKLRKKNKNIYRLNLCLSSPQNLEFGHFTLMFCSGHQRNVPKFNTNVQSDCFSSLNLLFCNAVFAVAVA